MTDPAQEVWRRLRGFVLDRHERRRRVGEVTGLSFARYKALRRIADGPLSLADLAGYLVNDRPYTTLIVDALEQRGLVTREKNPADGRSKLVRITEPGQALLAQALEIFEEPPPELRALDEEELGTLLAVLRRLTC